MIDLLAMSLVFGSSFWVLIDSRKIGIKKGTTKGFFNMGPTGWFLACLLFWIAAFPVYLVKRREHILAATENEQAKSAQDTGFVSQLGALRSLSTQGLLTADDFQTRRLELVSRILEQASHGDLISQLGTLADLSTQGFLTDEEFQTRKKELVRRMLDQSSDDDVVLASD